MTKREELRHKALSETVGRIDFADDLDEKDIYECIDDVLMGIEERRLFTPAEILKVREEVFASLRKMDILQEYLDDEEVTEIMVNGYDKIFIEKEGRLFETGKTFDSQQKLEDIIQQMVASCNRSVNETSPIADARLPSGERVNVVLPPIALNGPIVTIRRFPKHPITMKKLIELGSVTKEAAIFLKELVVARYNIFISGGTGSGKTTFLNALSQYIPADERIVTIEDSAELKLLDAENLVRLETRNANIEGCEPITIRDLIKTALRMRPERVIVGEVRGPEAMDMLQAMNTGHDGSLSTGHSNSTKDMLARLETMVLMGMEIPLAAVRGQISSGIDIMVHLGRMRDRSRKVLEISEIKGLEGGEILLNTLYLYEKGQLVKKNDLLNKEKMRKVYSE
ncbi:MAG: CpaF family protein [Lachnospiraceae bacterium]|nr:CpaF family protein [Lachnospiraceae bacterium]